MDDDLWVELEWADDAPSAPARAIDWLIVGVNFAKDASQAVTSLLENTTTLLLLHANHEVQQQQFADEARIQIERLTQEE